MKNPSSKQYLAMLTPWLKNINDFLRTSEYNPGLKYYGTGESAHWAVQSNMNVCAALAVAGVMKEDGNLIGLALSLFRYAMRTHVTGDVSATDGKKWGRHWISVLGTERMMHGIHLLKPYMTPDDLARYRSFREAESEWLLNEYPVVAGMIASEGKNHPESNIWNGSFLYRTALDYPDMPHTAEYMKKGIAFILNGISHPADAESHKLFHGKPLREWHAGPNFTENYSLDHHGYMNIGYSIICLSNLAMMYFALKADDRDIPECLTLHVRELWDVVRNFFFQDGRLLRIGGDTRTRYTYCQVYVIPSLIFISDFLHDHIASELEKNYLSILKKEQDSNPDGMFFSTRLSNIRNSSYFYYCRLESDPPLAISQGALWHSMFEMTSGAAQLKNECVWHDDFHSAFLLRTGKTIRSSVRPGGQGPTVLCVPSDRSDMAEWQGSGLADFGMNRSEHSTISKWGEMLPDSFVSCGVTDWTEAYPSGEGEGQYVIATSHSATVAIPDGHTLVTLEYAMIRKESTLQSLKTFNVKIPNDLFNGYSRSYSGDGFFRELKEYPPQPEIIDTGSSWLNVDGRLSVFSIYGADTIKINRPAKQNITCHSPNVRNLSSLYADELCGLVITAPARFIKGAVVADTAFALAADISAADSGRINVRRIPSEGLLRTVEIKAVDGKKYRIAVNFGYTPVVFEETLIAPGTALLFQ